MLKKILNKKTILITSLILIIIVLIIIKTTSQKTPDSTNPINNYLNNTTIYNPNQTTSTKNTPTIVDIGPTTPEGYTIYYETEENNTNPNTDYSYYTPPTLTPEEEEILDINKDFPLSRILPYQGTYFKVERYYDVNNLQVIVNSRNQTELAKQEIQQWLKNQGDDKYDTFTIFYK